MQESLSKYTFQFQHLTTAKIAGKQAPHKAILLLSIMDLVENGTFRTPRVELTERLETTFLRMWKRYIGTSVIFQPKVATPFWHLLNEPFYRLFQNNGQQITGGTGRYSIKWLRENTYATIDQELFTLMKDENARAELRVVLFSSYLKDNLTGSGVKALSSIAIVVMMLSAAPASPLYPSTGNNTQTNSIWSASIKS